MGNVCGIHHQAIFKLGDHDHTWSGVVLVIYNENFTSDENVRDIRVVWSVSLRGRFTLLEARSVIKKALSTPIEHLGVIAEISDGSGIDGYGVNVLFFVSRKQLELWNEPDFRSAISCFADELNKILVTDAENKALFQIEQERDENNFGFLEPVNLAEVSLSNNIDDAVEDLASGWFHDLDSLKEELSENLNGKKSLYPEESEEFDLPELDDPDDF